MTTKILLADDHKIVRDGLRSLLMMQSDMEVIGEADCGKATVDICRKLSPDVVVMDVSMPTMSGIEATQHILKDNRSVKVIALSMHSDKRIIVGMLRAGASAYLLKECAFEELVDAIRAVRDDQGYLSPRVAKLVMEDYLSGHEKQGASPASVLTRRERQVLELLAEGKRSKEAAEELGLSVRTVETHRQQLMNKLNIHKVAELVKYAIQQGMISINKPF